MVRRFSWLEHDSVLGHKIVLAEISFILQGPILKLSLCGHGFGDGSVQKVLNWILLGILWPLVPLVIMSVLELLLFIHLFVPVMQALRRGTILDLFTNAWVPRRPGGQALKFVEAIVKVGWHDMADAAPLDHPVEVAKCLPTPVLLV